MTPFCQGPGRSVEDNWIVDSEGTGGVRKMRGRELRVEAHVALAE